MIKEGKFGTYETICLLTIAISNKIFFTAPGTVTMLVGNASWLMTLISCTSAIVIFSFTYLLLKRFPGMDIIQIFDITFGRIIGFVLSFILFIFFLSGTGVLLREFTDILKIFSFRITPVGVLNVTCVVFVTIIVYLGLESIARLSSLIGKGVLFFYILLLILPVKDYNTYNVFPLWGYGIDKILFYGVKRTSAYSEILILAVIAGSLQGAKYIKRSGYMALILSGVFLSLGLLSYTLTFEYTTNQELIAPFYVMVRLINYGAFIQKLDPLLMIVWIFTTLVTLSIYFYCAVSVFCKMHRVNDTRPVILPVAILILTIAILPSSISELIEVYINNVRDLGDIVVVLPIIALIAAVIRKKRGENSEA